MNDMSCDFWNDEYRIGDSEFGSEEYSEQDSVNEAELLASSLKSAPSFERRMSILHDYFGANATPTELALNAFISELQQRPKSLNLDQDIWTDLESILKFLTADQVHFLIDFCGVDATNPLLLNSALERIDVDGSCVPDLSLAKFLLQQGSDPNAGAVTVPPPLTRLIRNASKIQIDKCVEAVKLLVSYGASFIKPGACLDPLRESALKRQEHIFEAFIELNDCVEVEHEARELMWASLLADMRLAESAIQFEKLLNLPKNLPRTAAHRFRSVDKFMNAQIAEQLKAGLDTMLEWFKRIQTPTTEETRLVHQIVGKFVRAADIRLTSASEFAAFVHEPYCLGVQITTFNISKKADLNFKNFANLAMSYCQTVVSNKQAIRAHLGELLRCTTRQNEVESQLNELSDPDELGATLCAVTAVLEERQRNELWTPQDTEYEEHLVHSLLKRGAYVRHSGWETRSPIDMLDDISNMPQTTARLMTSSNCCVRDCENPTSENKVPSLKCEAARSLSNRKLALTDDELQYRIFVKRSSVASLKQFVKAHHKIISRSE